MLTDRAIITKKELEAKFACLHDQISRRDGARYAIIQHLGQDLSAGLDRS